MRLVGEWDLPGHSGPVYALACDYERKALYSAGGDGYIAEWRCISGKQARAIARTPGAVYSLHFVPSIHHLYVGESSGIVYVLDIGQKTLRRSVRAHQSSVFGLGSHPSDPEGWSSGRDGAFIYWDTARSEPFAAVKVASAGLRDFVLSPKMTSFLCAGRDGYVYEVERFQRSVLQRVWVDPHFVIAIEASPVNGLVATGGRSGILKLWTADLELKWEVPAHTITLNTIAWHPSGRIIATGGRDRLIHLWDVQTGKKLLTLSGHLRSVNALLWISEDTLASAGDDGLVKIWHLEDSP